MGTSSALGKIRLTSAFGKACALTACLATGLMYLSIGQLVYDAANETGTFDKNAAYSEQQGRTASSVNLFDNYITPMEGIGIFTVPFAAGALGIMAGNSRKRQIRAYNADYNNAASGDPPNSGGDLITTRSRSSGYNGGYYQRDRFWEGYWFGSWMNSSSSSSSGGGFSSSRRSSSSNDKGAGAAILIMLLIALTATATWMSVKATKLNFFSDEKPKSKADIEKLKLTPLP